MNLVFQKNVDLSSVSVTQANGKQQVYYLKDCKVITHSSPSTVDLYDKLKKKDIVLGVPLASVIDGRTGVAFVSLAAVGTFVTSDFYLATT